MQANYEWQTPYSSGVYKHYKTCNFSNMYYIWFTNYKTLVIILLGTVQLAIIKIVGKDGGYTTDIVVGKDEGYIVDIDGHLQKIQVVLTLQTTQKLLR